MAHHGLVGRSGIGKSHLTDYYWLVDLSLWTDTNLKAGSAMESIEIGMQAPDFFLEDCYGKPVSLTGLRGKKVILYFFTSPGGGN